MVECLSIAHYLFQTMCTVRLPKSDHPRPIDHHQIIHTQQTILVQHLLPDQLLHTPANHLLYFFHFHALVAVVERVPMRNILHLEQSPKLGDPRPIPAQLRLHPSP